MRTLRAGQPAVKGPTPGANRVVQIRPNAAAADGSLTPDEIVKIHYAIDG